jgi:hypothetical protein
MGLNIDAKDFIEKHELTLAFASLGNWVDQRYAHKNYPVAKFLLPAEISFKRRISQVTIKEILAAYIGNFDKNAKVQHFNFPHKIHFKHLLIFIRDWFSVLIHFFKYKHSGKNSDFEITIFKMHGLEALLTRNGSGDFAKFCDEVAIAPFNDKKRKVICWGNFKEEIEAERFIFTKNPFYFLPFKQLGFLQTVKFLFWHFYFGFTYFLQSLFAFDFTLLSKDFAWLSMWKTINENHFIKDYVLENSAYDNQEIFIEELPQRTFTSHIVFYAINHMGLKYAGVEGVSNSPQFKYMVADYGWVWNKIQLKWLKENSALRKMTVVGSIHFMPLPKVNRIKNPSFQIAVFDTTPYTAEYLLSSLGWKGSFFHSENVMVAFLKDISLLKRDIPELRIVLKTKRGFHKNHSQAYQDLCLDLIARGVMQEYSHDLNVVSLIDSSDFVISAPFTSPGFVAAERGVESAFYAPEGVIEDNLDLHSEKINFINSYDQLLKLTQKMMREK